MLDFQTLVGDQVDLVKDVARHDDALAGTPPLPLVQVVDEVAARDDDLGVAPGDVGWSLAR